MSTHESTLSESTPTVLAEEDASGPRRVESMEKEKEKGVEGVDAGAAPGSGAVESSTESALTEAASAESAETTEPTDTEPAPKPFDPFDDPEGLGDDDDNNHDNDGHDNHRGDDHDIEASVATLKPPLTPLAGLSLAPSSSATSTYIDPTPATPMTSHPPSRSTSHAASQRSPERSPQRSPTRSDAADIDGEDRRYLSDDDAGHPGGASTRRSEIQTIMEQFSGDGGGPGEDEVMSPRLEIAAPMLAPPLSVSSGAAAAAGGVGGSHPPRKSSLEPLAPGLAQHIKESVKAMPGDEEPEEEVDVGAARATKSAGSIDKGKREDRGPPVPPKDGKDGTVEGEEGRATTDDNGPISPTVSLHRPPPPAPEPEPTLPFDFHRFLEQLRHKKADPVARYLKSFLAEFAKKQWMVHEQVKIISDFLAFISDKMAVCEVWRDLSDAEFDNAREGMEKLVMNRLYSQTFSPAIPPPQPIPGARPKRRGGERPMGPGRRGQHQEDVERDEVLSQKITIYGWVRERHLDIAPVAGEESGRRFLRLAQQELLKIKTYRAPRDKIICVLNCCKVIFGLLKHNKADESADSFMPLLIYVVLQANPDHLVSNVQYILRFRHQDKLVGEAGYYLSSLMGAVQFIENMDRTTLTITDAEFEANVEAAVSAIAEKHRAASPPLPIPPEGDGDGGDDEKRSGHKAAGDSLKPGDPSGAGPSARTSADADRPRTPKTPRTPRTARPRPTSRSRESSGEAGEGGGNDKGEAGEAGGDGDDGGDADDGDRDAITGLLRTIQRPLSTIGRLFAEEPASPTDGAAHPRGRSPGRDAEGGDPAAAAAAATRRQALSAEEAAARQASAETAEAQRLHRVEHANIVETLAGMFPDLDRDIISDVVYQKEGRVGLAVDACLALSQ